MKLAIGLMIAFQCCGLAAGSVTQGQTPQQLGQSDIWVLQFDWTGDASNGSVPTIRAQGLAALSGYQPIGVQFTPGTPAPTSGYSVVILSALVGSVTPAADILGGSGATLSATASSYGVLATGITPLVGTITMAVTGNSVNSAKGTVQVFFQKPGLFARRGASGGANPTASVGLTAINGAAGTFMRSDAAPPLSQAIVPTWTGLHTFTATAGGIAMAGSPNNAKTFGGQSAKVGFSSDLTGITTATNPEANIFLQMQSSVGAGSPLGAYKAAILSNVIGNNGSADVWNGVLSLQLGAGGAKRSGVVLEADLNNEWGNYPGSPGYPYASNFHATGTNAGGYSSSAFNIQFGGNASPMWNYGIAAGLPGFQVFNTAFILDESNSPIIVKATGAHNNGIDLQDATFIGAAFVSPGYSVNKDGWVEALRVKVTPASTARCSFVSDIGNTWFDNSSPADTLFKVCLNVANTPTWVTK